MNWAEWAPTYRQIVHDFGYDERADASARDLLDALLEPKLVARLPDVRGRDVVVLGPARFARVPEGPLFVTDPRALPPRPPDLVVTDLDGDVGLQVALNALGVPLVVHAHGDNQDTLRQVLPELRGPLAGSTQVEPKGRVANFGGFTDGDRACCIAAHLGASSVTLVGFDWDSPQEKAGRERGVKARKLAWAKRIVEALPIPVRYA